MGFNSAFKRLSSLKMPENFNIDIYIYIYIYILFVLLHWQGIIVISSSSSSLNNPVQINNFIVFNSYININIYIYTLVCTVTLTVHHHHHHPSTILFKSAILKCSFCLYFFHSQRDADRQFSSFSSGNNRNARYITSAGRWIRWVQSHNFTSI